MKYVLDKAKELMEYTDYQDLFAGYHILARISFDYAVAVCVKGCGIIRCGDEITAFYKKDCIFVPACSVMITLHGKAQFLDVRG